MAVASWSIEMTYESLHATAIHGRDAWTQCMSMIHPTAPRAIRRVIVTATPWPSLASTVQVSLFVCSWTKYLPEAAHLARAQACAEPVQVMRTQRLVQRLDKACDLGLEVELS